MALLSAKRKNVSLSPPLPFYNSIFSDNRMVLRQGQFTLLAAAPSVGKSVLARNIVALSSQMSSLYFSADSDEYTVRTSVLGALSGYKMSDIESNMQSEAWADYFAATLAKADQVEWNFSPSINLDYIDLKLRAYAEVYGEFPMMTVVDNLGDLVTEGDEEYAELRSICRELRRMARYANTHILGLVHTKGPYEDGTKPITLGALLGNLGKVPENVLGLHWADSSGKRVQMTVPKMRGSKRGMTIDVPFDYETGRVGGFQ